MLSAPDYLPARMVNEFVYCPRLFFYEWVEGVFVDNRETVEGSLRHQKLERRDDALPSPDKVASGELIHSRSVQLSSDRHRLIAKMDLIEGAQGLVTPVDYKRGAPREARDGSIVAWDADRVQLCVQALVLRDNGYRCDEGVIYYVMTKQRVRVPIDDALVAETLSAVERAFETAAAGRIPPPLADSPKCPRCSLVGICLPDETRACARHGGGPTVTQLTLFDVGEPPDAASFAATGAPAGRGNREDPLDGEVRKLLPARDDLRPLYLNTQGYRVGKSGQVLQVHEKDKLVQEVRLGDICQLNLFGNVQLTTQAIQTLCECEIPIAYFSMGGWFYGVTHGLGIKNIFLRREQFRLADVPSFCLRLSRALVAGKIRNQRTMLQRNHVEPPARALVQMKCMLDDAERAATLEELLGIEGNAARVYFEQFAGMIKIDDDPYAAAAGGAAQGETLPPTRTPSREESGAEERGVGHSDPTHADQPAGNGRAAARGPAGTDGNGAALPSNGSAPRKPFAFDFVHRNRRPPRDPVNALLSLAYSMLSKDLAIVSHAVGFDPYMGFYHQPRFGRAALALDLMEPFRPLIADSAVLTAINTRMVTAKDFMQTGQAVALKPEGRKAFFRAYEQRMDTLVTHPLFGYRVNYRRVLEIQTRLLARVLTGEMSNYSVFTTR